MNAHEMGTLANWLAEISDACRKYGIDLGNDYDRDGGPCVAAYIDGEVVAVIAVQADGYNVTELR